MHYSGELGGRSVAVWFAVLLLARVCVSMRCCVVLYVVKRSWVVCGGEGRMGDDKAGIAVVLSEAS